MSRCWTGTPTTSFWRPMPTMMSIPSLNDAALADRTAVKEGHVYQLPHARGCGLPVPGSFLGSVYLGSVLHRAGE